MAGVDAILGSVSVRNLAASKGAASVTTANGTRQFENFLKDSGSAKNSLGSADAGQNVKTQESLQGNQQNFAKKEEFSVSQEGTTGANSSENVSDAGGSRGTGSSAGGYP